MTARFAGSRSVDERRRRRLATDPDDAPAAPETPPLDEAATAEVDTSARDERVAAVELAAVSETWMPARAWKAWLLFTAVLAGSAGAIVGGWFVDRDPTFYGPELSALLGLESGRLLHTLGSLWLLLAAQLALVVWWRRSRSTRDFEGRYDIWLWTAAGWSLFAVAHEMRLHLVWSDAVALAWPPDFWNKTILSWFVPAVGAGGVLWMAARADARRCRSGWWMMTLAGPCWVAAGMLILGVGSADLGPWQQVAIVSTALAGHVLGFGGMLLHARFVTHVCNDPPVARPRVRKERPVKPAKSEKRRSAKDAATTSSTADEYGDENGDFAAPAAKRSPRRTRSAAKSTAPTTKPETAGKSSPTPKPRPATDTAPADEPEPAAVLRMVDSPEYDTEYDEDGNTSDGPPPEMLHGLSKRQKKKLRKEWRDRQRAARADAA